VQALCKQNDDYSFALSADFSAQVPNESLLYQTPVATQLIRFLHLVWRFRAYVRQGIHGTRPFTEFQTTVDALVKSITDYENNVELLDPIPRLHIKENVRKNDLQKCLSAFKELTKSDTKISEFLDFDNVSSQCIQWYITVQLEAHLLIKILTNILA